MSGDRVVASPQESTAQMIDAFTKGINPLMQSYNQVILPNEQAKLEAAKTISPAYAALDNEIYKMFGPDAAKTTLDIAKIQDPEYYKVREAAGAKILDMMNNPLTAGEEEAINRAYNQEATATGNTSNPSQLQVIKKANTFGGAARQRLSQALDTAINATPLLGSNKQTFTESRTGGSNQNLGSQALSMGSELLNQAGANTRESMNLNANRRSGWDRTLGAVSGITNALGNVFSFGL